MIGARVGAEATSMSQVWLTMKGFSLHMKGSLYTACVRSTMLYGNEMWGVSEEDIYTFERIEMRMVRRMSNATL